MTSWLDEALAGLAPIGLDEVDDRMALQTRSDLKYVVDRSVLTDLVGELGADATVLEIDGLRTFRYESVYFDTPEFRSYLGAARRRPDRFKVRTRRYVETETCWVEVKRRTRRGMTIKTRRGHDPGRPATLTPEALTFVSGFEAVRPHAVRLRPVVRTRYRRATLVVGGQRVTVDTDLSCDDLGSRTIGVGERLVVETKSSGGPGPVDRALWSRGCRPVVISKFAVAMASFHPELPANRWRRTLDRFVVRCDAERAARVG